MSASVKNQKNRDQGPWSLVLNFLVLAIAFHTSIGISQTASSAKSKTPEKTVSKLAADEPDDNGEDESEEEDAPDASIVDENSDESDEEKPVVAAPTEKPEEAVENETALEAGDSLEEAAVTVDKPPVETVPVQTTPEPEPYVPPATLEAKSNQPNKIYSEAEMVEVIPREKTVEIEPFKQYSSYRQRRTTHGFMFNVNAENLYFQDYTSIVDQKLYEELFGQEDLTLVQVQLDYKLNFFLGSLVSGVGYGQGTLVDDRYIDSTTNTNQERELTIEKKSARLQLVFDNLMNEPYFAPYVGASYWQFGITEKNNTAGTKNSYDTGNGTSLTVGFLIQLNWMDPQVAKLAYMGDGLENTYLDVFWTQYQNTDDELDPVFENDFNFGMGLRMEF